MSSDTGEGTVTGTTNDQLTFSSSNWSAEQTVTVTGVADNLSDGDQSFAILLSDNSSGDALPVCGSAGCLVEESGSDG